MGLFDNVCRSVKIHNLPKKTPHQVFFSPMSWPRDGSHRQRPPTNQLYGPCRGFVTGSNKRPGVQTIRNTHLNPITHPSPGVNPPISPPFLTPVRRGPSDVRIPKDMDFFPCHYTTFRVVQCRTTSLNTYTWKKATNLSLFSLSWCLHTWRRNISGMRNSHFELFFVNVLSILYLKINPIKGNLRRLVSKTGTQSI